MQIQCNLMPKKQLLPVRYLNSTDDVLAAQIWELLEKAKSLPLPATNEKRKRELGFLKENV